MSTHARINLHILSYSNLLWYGMRLKAKKKKKRLLTEHNIKIYFTVLQPLMHTFITLKPVI